MAFTLISRDLLTLPLALLLGSGIAALFRAGGQPSPVADVPSAPSAPARKRAVASVASPAAAPRESSEAQACAEAWELLKDGRLTCQDRTRAQTALLEEWSRHDLSAALVAYAAELPVGRFGSYGIKFNPLPAMITKPELVEELLKSGRLGLEAGQLRATWLRHLAKTDPVGVLDRIDELSGQMRIDVIGRVAELLPSISEDAATWQEGMARISAMMTPRDTWAVTQATTMGLGLGSSYEDLNAAYLATTDPRLKELIAMAPHAAAATKGGAHTEIPGEIESLSEPFRSAVIENWNRKSGNKPDTAPE